MEFPFDVASLIGAPSGHSGPYVGLVDERMLRGGRGQDLCSVLEAMGKSSAIAQGLKKPVTFGTTCLLGQRIYLMAQGRNALGILKVGTKRLFVAPPPALQGTRSTSSIAHSQGNLKEIEPVCALDFYVHESCQRGGFGRRIFDEMLRQEGLAPAQIAYDRPSSKFIGFLRKHFGLARYQPQNNNFVVFDEYYSQKYSRSAPPVPRGSGGVAVIGADALSDFQCGVIPGMQAPHRAPSYGSSAHPGSSQGESHQRPVHDSQPASSRDSHQRPCNDSQTRPPLIPCGSSGIVGPTSHYVQDFRGAGPDSRGGVSISSSNPVGTTSRPPSLQAPWGQPTSDESARRCRSGSGSRRSFSSAQLPLGGADSRPAAGHRQIPMTGNSQARSTSTPVGRASSVGVAGIFGGTQDANPPVGSRRRFESPLSRAGHHLLAH